AYSVLISLTFYNLMRFMLIWWKFKIQPFSIKTIFIVLSALFAYFVVLMLFPESTSIFLNIALRSLIFGLIFGLIVLLGRLSEDVTELWDMVKQRLRR